MKTFPETLRETNRGDRPYTDREVTVVPMRTRMRVRRFSREEIADELTPRGFSAVEAQDLRRRGEMPSSGWNEPRKS